MTTKSSDDNAVVKVMSETKSLSYLLNEFFDKASIVKMFSEGQRLAEAEYRERNRTGRVVDKNVLILTRTHGLLYEIYSNVLKECTTTVTEETDMFYFEGISDDEFKNCVLYFAGQKFK